MITDLEYFQAYKIVFPTLKNLFLSDATIALTDTERYVLFEQAKTFKVDFSIGQPILKNGSSELAIKTKKLQVVIHTKESLGLSAIAHAIPIINNDTDNVVGTLMFITSRQKESDVIDLANELTAFVEELSASSEELAGSSILLAENSINVTKITKEAKDSILKSDEILNYIKGIANTTNMLGLNASIEAARAGEYGKGFAIVAQEIRKLAISSKTSVSEINDTLTNVSANIDKIYNLVKELSTTSQDQSAQAEEIAAGSQRLSELASKLFSLSESLNK